MYTIVSVVKKLYPNQFESGNITFYMPENRILIQSWEVEGVEKPSEDYLESLIPQYEFEFSVDAFEHLSTVAVREHIESVAKQRKYDSTLSCTSYTNSTNLQWKAEADAFIAWRDAVLDFCYTNIERIRNQEISIPTIEELLSSLPEITWP